MHKTGSGNSPVIRWRLVIELYEVSGSMLHICDPIEMTDKWCSTCTAIEHPPFTCIAMRPEVRVCATQMAPNSQDKTEVSNQRWRFIMEKYKGKK